MSEASSSKAKGRRARPAGIRRVQIGANVIAQLALVAALVVMANYFAFKYYKRWDLSRTQKYTLSSQTTNLLANLKNKVQVYVFFNPGVAFYRDLDATLKEYQYAGGDKVELEFVDPYRNFTRARDLQAKYKFGAAENLVILDYEGRSKFVNEADLADFDQGGGIFGDAPQLRAFKGEQALTGALLEIVENRANKVAFLGGHGELEPVEAGPIKGLVQYIVRQNAKAESLNLSSVDKIPEDVRLIVIAAPKYDLSEREEKLLREFWENRGRLFVALVPGAPTPRLHTLIRSVGILPNDDRVLRTVSMGPGLVGVLKDVSGVFQGGSPATRNLEGVASLLLGGAQSLKLEDQLVRSSGIRLQPLIVAAEGFWGESDHDGGPDAPVAFDEGKDTKAPVVLGASAEKGGVGDPSVKVDSSRMIVVGNSGFLLDEALTESNLDFFLASLNWMLDRQETSGIAPKSVDSFSLNLTDAQVGRILQICMLAIPLAVAVLGAGVWWTRRR